MGHLPPKGYLFDPVELTNGLVQNHVYHHYWADPPRMSAWSSHGRQHKVPGPGTFKDAIEAVKQATNKLNSQKPISHRRSLIGNYHISMDFHVSYHYRPEGAPIIPISISRQIEPSENYQSCSNIIKKITYHYRSIGNF